MSLKRIFHLTKRQKLPRLRHHLTNGREMDEPDESVQALLDAGLVRDWIGGKRLVGKTNKSASTLFWELSKKRKPDWRRRLRNILIVSFGGMIHDPHQKEMYELTGGNHERKIHNPNKHIEGGRYKRW